MSCILKAVDSEGTGYLLLDCTRNELFNIGLLLNLYINLDSFKDVNGLKLKLEMVKDTRLHAMTGMLKRNFVQMMGLLEMDFPVNLDYEFDFSEPTSDYRYPILKVKPDNSDEEFIDGFTEVKCTNPEEYDEFMEWTLPKFVENVNVFFGSEGQYDYYIGKTQNGTYVYSKDKFTGNLSDDLFFELQD
jgi:hypothetical protein